MVNWFSTRMPRKFYHSAAGTTGYPLAIGWSWISTSCHMHNAQNGSWAKTIKVLEENVGKNLHDLELGNGLLNMTLNTQGQKYR